MISSNACKFTPTGGKLMVTTKLVIPNLRSEDDSDDFSEKAINIPLSESGEKADTDAPSSTAAGSEGRAGQYFLPYKTWMCAESYIEGDNNEKPLMRSRGLSRSLLSQHDVLHSKQSPLEWIVVRIEVTDTGCGIRPEDMVQTKLFCEWSHRFHS